MHKKEQHSGDKQKTQALTSSNAASSEEDERPSLAAALFLAGFNAAC
jgi:hypothetical protein